MIVTCMHTAGRNHIIYSIIYNITEQSLCDENEVTLLNCFIRRQKISQCNIIPVQMKGQANRGRCWPDFKNA